MANYKVVISKSAKKELEKLPKKDLQKIVRAIQRLSENPRPQGCEKLSGYKYYRIRQGDHRIVYSIQDGELTILVIKIGHRKDIYKRL